MTVVKKETVHAAVTRMTHKDTCANCGLYGNLVDELCPDCFDEEQEGNPWEDELGRD
jgi:hypothetical protein